MEGTATADDILNFVEKGLVTEFEAELDRNPKRVNELGEGGSTPLHLAAHAGNSELVRVLLSRGANVGLKNSVKRMPLHNAVARGWFDVAVLLLENEAKVNISDANGDLPLHVAVARNDGAISKLLLQHGASVRMTNNVGQSALKVAVENQVADDIFVDLVLNDLPLQNDGTPNEKYGNSWSFFMDVANAVPPSARKLVVEIIFNEFSQPAAKKLMITENRKGHKIMDATDSSTKLSIKQRLFFCGRYQLVFVDGPVLNRSKGSKMLKALDYGAGDGTVVSDPVAIKFMRNKGRCRREVELLKDACLSDKYVLQALTVVEADKAGAGSSAAPFADSEDAAGDQEQDMVKLFLGSDAWSIVVLPWAPRTLQDIYTHERPKIHQIRAIMRDVAKALEHVHRNGLMHGNVKRSHVIRVSDGSYRLIDFSGAGFIANEAAGADTYWSSGNYPPEMFARVDAEGEAAVLEYWRVSAEAEALSEGEEGGAKQTELWKQVAPVTYRRSHVAVTHVVRAFRVDDDKGGPVTHVPPSSGSLLPYALVRASVAIDLWAFATMLFRLCAGRPLLPVDEREQLSLPDAVFKAATWTDQQLGEQIRHGVKDTLAANLLRHMFRADLSDRLQSFAEVLCHPFFTEAGNEGPSSASASASASPSAYKPKSTGTDNNSGTTEEDKSSSASSSSSMSKMLRTRDEYIAAVDARSAALERVTHYVSDLSDEAFLHLRRVRRTVSSGWPDLTAAETPTCLAICTYDENFVYEHAGGTPRGEEGGGGAAGVGGVVAVGGSLPSLRRSAIEDIHEGEEEGEEGVNMQHLMVKIFGRIIREMQILRMNGFTDGSAFITAVSDLCLGGVLFVYLVDEATLTRVVPEVDARRDKGKDKSISNAKDKDNDKSGLNENRTWSGKGHEEVGDCNSSKDKSKDHERDVNNNKNSDIVDEGAKAYPFEMDMPEDLIPRLFPLILNSLRAMAMCHGLSGILDFFGFEENRIKDIPPDVISVMDNMLRFFEEVAPPGEHIHMLRYLMRLEIQGFRDDSEKLFFVDTLTDVQRVNCQQGTSRWAVDEMGKFLARCDPANTFGGLVRVDCDGMQSWVTPASLAKLKSKDPLFNPNFNNTNGASSTLRSSSQVGDDRDFRRGPVDITRSGKSATSATQSDFPERSVKDGAGDLRVAPVFRPVGVPAAGQGVRAGVGVGVGTGTGGSQGAHVGQGASARSQPSGRSGGGGGGGGASSSVRAPSTTGGAMGGSSLHSSAHSPPKGIAGMNSMQPGTSAGPDMASSLEGGSGDPSVKSAFHADRIRRDSIGMFKSKVAPFNPNDANGTQNVVKSSHCSIA